MSSTAIGVGVGDIADDDDNPLIEDGDGDNNVDDDDDKEALFMTPPFNVPLAPVVASWDKDEDVELLSFA